MSDEQDSGASLRDRATAVEPVPVSPLRDGIPCAADYACAERANAMWGAASNGPHVAVLAAMLAREEAVSAPDHKLVPRQATDHQIASMTIMAECMLEAVNKIDVGLIYATGVEAAQGIEARSEETPQAAQPEGQEPDPRGCAPSSDALLSEREKARG